MDLETLVTDLVDCLCAEVDTGELCSCAWVPGEAVAFDLGDCREKCGQAWVRVGEGYPAVTAGQFSETTNNFDTFLGVDIEVGVIRCIPIPDDGGPVEPAVASAHALVQVEDMQAMRRAIFCCESVRAVDHILGNYTPVGPQGMVVGGFWQMAVML